MVLHHANRIGTGSNADVYGTQATDPHEVRFACKVLHPDYARNLKSRERFAKEIALIWSFNHPNIVRVHGGWMEHNPADGIFPTLVMELLPFSLANVLWPSSYQAEPLSNRIKLSIIRQLAEVLAFLHNRNPIVVHMDIKPENILLTPDYTPKLCDFGVAKTFTKTFRAFFSSTGVAGTAAYEVSFDFTSVSCHQ